MGVQSRRQVRAALVFVARPLLFAIVLTVFARVFFSGGHSSKTTSSTVPPLQELKPIPKHAGLDTGPEAETNAQAQQHPPAKAYIEPKRVQEPVVGGGHDSHGGGGSGQGAIADDGHRELTRALVVASTSKLVAKGDTAWLAGLPPAWQGAVYHYVTDAPLSPELAVPVNKGNEAMAYLTYIVDHYDALPDVVLFHHGHRRGWHQAMDSAEEVRRLRLAYVARRGYASLRCLPGCENVIVLADYAVEPSEFRRHGRDVQLTTLLDDFLDKEAGERVPVRLASPCCAQFAASRAAIRRRSREWWRSLRQWVTDTPVSDMESGRLMEHTWHVWLGNESFHCPEYNACQCHVYGIGQCEAYFALEDAM